MCIPSNCSSSLLCTSDHVSGKPRTSLACMITCAADRRWRYEFRMAPKSSKGNKAATLSSPRVSTTLESSTVFKDARFGSLQPSLAKVSQNSAHSSTLANELSYAESHGFFCRSQCKTFGRTLTSLSFILIFPSVFPRQRPHL